MLFYPNPVGFFRVKLQVHVVTYFFDAFYSSFQILMSYDNYEIICVCTVKEFIIFKLFFDFFKDFLQIYIKKSWGNWRSLMDPVLEFERFPIGFQIDFTMQLSQKLHFFWQKDVFFYHQIIYSVPVYCIVRRRVVYVKQSTSLIQLIRFRFRPATFLDLIDKFKYVNLRS